MKLSSGTKGGCANFSENRLLSYRGADNAALGTSVSFPPLFTLRSVKTEVIVTKPAQPNVKTDSCPNGGAE